MREWKERKRRINVRRVENSLLVDFAHFPVIGFYTNDKAAKSWKASLLFASSTKHSFLSHCLHAKCSLKWLLPKTKSSKMCPLFIACVIALFLSFAQFVCRYVLCLLLLLVCVLLSFLFQLLRITTNRYKLNVSTENIRYTMQMSTVWHQHFLYIT